MSDTRKIEEQPKEELLKDCELSLEDLGKVTGGTGGFEQNADGTYNIYDGQLIRLSDQRYAHVYGNYLNATLSTTIQYYYYVVDLNGDMIESAWSLASLDYLMPYFS